VKPRVPLAFHMVEAAGIETTTPALPSTSVYCRNPSGAWPPATCANSRSPAFLCQVAPTMGTFWSQPAGQSGSSGHSAAAGVTVLNRWSPRLCVPSVGH
jgi:hypothetical protein